MLSLWHKWQEDVLGILCAQAMLYFQDERGAKVKTEFEY